MQLYFPHDERFSFERFAYTPIRIIFQALEYGHKFYKEKLHCQELGIATLTSYFVNANKDPKKGSRVTPADFFFFQPDASTDIAPDVATTFFSLIDDKMVPPWVVSLIPVKSFTQIRSRGNITKPRALVGIEANVFIISPKIYTYNIYCQFIVAWEVNLTESSRIKVKDVDNSTLYSVELFSDTTILTLSHSNYTIPRLLV